MNAPQPRVLVVDDEPAVREMICYTLNRAGMEVLAAADAREALGRVYDERPDIILLDWMMPGIGGLEFTRRLRREPVTAEIPIIMLTARVSEDDRVAGLDAGTDDYVAKPFSPRELVARIQAVLRRSGAANAQGRIRAGSLVLDTRARRVTAADRELRLGPTEYRLLAFFMSNPGRAYSRSQLLDHVWGPNAYLEERSVDVQVRRLRKALSPAGLECCLQTVRGFGYRFVAEG